jgi:hypothetical protein
MAERPSAGRGRAADRQRNARPGGATARGSGHAGTRRRSAAHGSSAALSDERENDRGRNGQCRNSECCCRIPVSAPRSLAGTARSAAPPAITGGTPAQKTTIEIAPTIARISAPRPTLSTRGTITQNTIAATMRMIAHTPRTGASDRHRRRGMFLSLRARLQPQLRPLQRLRDSWWATVPNLTPDATSGGRTRPDVRDPRTPSTRARTGQPASEVLLGSGSVGFRWPAFSSAAWVSPARGG